MLGYSYSLRMMEKFDKKKPASAFNELVHYGAS